MLLKNLTKSMKTKLYLAINMKNTILILFFILSYFFSPAFAQNANRGKAEDYKKEMWQSADPAFMVKDVPEKWKGESAVVIAQYIAYEYKKPPILLQLYENEIYHRRIKLLDKAAVESYSEFEFPEDIFLHRAGSLYFYVGIKIVKPGGSENIVDISKAVEIKQKSGREENKYKKLAIPDLEVGDILDIYLCSEKTIGISSYPFYSFRPVVYSLEVSTRSFIRKLTLTY